jgi:hypothetical protein
MDGFLAGLDDLEVLDIRGCFLRRLTYPLQTASKSQHFTPQGLKGLRSLRKVRWYDMALLHEAYSLNQASLSVNRRVRQWRRLNKAKNGLNTPCFYAVLLVM